MMIKDTAYIAKHFQLKKILFLKICCNSRHPQERSDARIQTSKSKAFRINTKQKHTKNIKNQMCFYRAIS